MSLLGFFRTVVSLIPPALESTLAKKLDNLARNQNDINNAAISENAVDRLARYEAIFNTLFTGYTIDVSNGRRQCIFLTTSGQNLPVTLPISANLEVGDEFLLFYESKDGAFTVSSVLQGSQTINGGGNVTLTNANDFVRLYYADTDLFYIIGGNI